MRQVLKYPGSKWGIAGQLNELVPPHHSYVEPYFGSGALLFTKRPSDIETVNDLDGNVANLFRCIQQDSQRLARLVMTTPFSREEYDRQFDGQDCASRYQRIPYPVLAGPWIPDNRRKGRMEKRCAGAGENVCPVELVPAAGMDHRVCGKAEEGAD